MSTSVFSHAILSKKRVRGIRAIERKVENGQGRASRTVRPVEQDPPGGVRIQGPGGDRAVAVVREGNQELLARVVPLLRFGRHPTDEQRSGTPVRVPSLPRATFQRAQAG